MTVLPDPATFSMATAEPLAAPRPVDAPGWLRRALGSAAMLLGQIALSALLINLLALATTLYSITVFNRILPAGAMSSLLALTFGMVMLLGFDFALRTLRGYFTDLAARRLDRVLGAELFDSLTRLPLRMRQRGTGQLAGALREFETVREFAASASVTVIADLPFVLLNLLVIALIAPELVLVPAAAVLLICATALLSHPLLTRLAGAGLGQALSKQSILVETIAGLDTLRAAHGTGMMARRWAAAVDAHAAASLRQRLLAALPVNLATTGQSLVYVLTLALGVELVETGALTLGALVAGSMLAGRCIAPLAQAAALATRYSATRAAWQTLDRLIRSADPRCLPAVRLPAIAGGLSFEDVRFTYPGSDRPAVDGLSFGIAPGERVAIVGRSGSGKSTVVRLALGLVQPDRGAIRLDGHDLRALDPEDLRRGCGAALQDALLFSGTIADNLRLGHADISDADLLEACRLAGADAVVGRLPAGHGTLLADRGESLSGGQRQLLALARALLGPGGRPRPLLLLDEPTSALDLLTEAALIDRLEPALEGRTLLMVTHRPSALRLATRILLIENGRVVADGPRAPMLQHLGLSQT